MATEFHELFGNSDSDDSDFEGFYVTDADASDRDEGLDEFHELFGDSGSDSEFDGFERSSDNESDANARPSRFDYEKAYDHPWLGKFNATHGPILHNMNDDTHPSDIFLTFFTPELKNIIVEETSRYATQSIEARGGVEALPNHSRFRKWEATSEGEVKAFLALLVLSGLDKRQTFDSYWSTSRLIEMPGFKSVMSRDRFLNILCYLHLTNNDDALLKDNPQYDRLYKLRNFINHLVPLWQSAFYPNRDVAVDKSIIALKGKTGMEVCKPNKPHKWGLNAWTLADSKTGYVYN